MKLELEKSTKKLEKMKKDLETKTDTKLQKRIDDEEKRLRSAQKELMTSKSKSSLMVSVLSIGIMITLRKVYAGKIVARLPFEPIWMFKNLAGAGIESDGTYSECGYIFLYILCNMSIKASIQKACGFTTTRAVDALAQAQTTAAFEDKKK